MSAELVVLILTWCALSTYALLAGADSGAGAWDLIAGSAHVGRDRRRLIEHVLGPVWEANHVWLIFVLVLLWTAFPPVFASIAATEWIPLTLAALGVIGRGSAFAFRKTVTTVVQQRLFGAVFAVCSVVTPFFLGCVAGAIAADRVPPRIGAGDAVRSWTAPTALLTGVLAMVACAFLAAVYLAGDARRERAAGVSEWFRRRALVAGTTAGAMSLAGLVGAHHDAPHLYTGLTGRGLPLVALSATSGVAALALTATRRYLVARLAAGTAVAAVVWGWGVAQYPRLLPGLSATRAAAVPSTLHAVIGTSVIGLALLLPSLWWLLRLFQTPPASGSGPPGRAAPGPAPR